MPLQNTPIRRKTMAIILLTSGAVLLLTCTSLFVYEFVAYRESTARSLATLGKVIAANSTAALAFENQDDAKEILGALKAEPHIVAACLYDSNGKVFSTYPPGLSIEALPAAPKQDGHQFESASLSSILPVAQGTKRLGTLYLKSDMGAIYERFRLYGGIVVLVITVSFLLAYTLSRALQKQISEPILALAETAKAVSDRRDYSVRATKLGEDELGYLTDTFNLMLGQIQEQNASLKEKEERLAKALASSEAAGEQVRRLNENLEARVRQRTQQLEAANKELEAFSYSVSHDLRAPLRHLNGFVELLDNSAGDALNEKCRRYLKIISQSGEQMGQLIDDLLAFARMGRVEMREEPVDLARLVQDTIRSLQPEIKDRRVVWKYDGLPLVEGDPSLLKQVFVNLLSNAVKYTRPRETAQIEIGCASETAEEVVMFVRDNGVGFDMKFADKLFGVFQRLHRAEEFEGTGIGLANVRRIIVRHGGRIWAESAVNAGATFYFSLRKPQLPPPNATN
jgi:signal transduction histidine kinase